MSGRTEGLRSRSRQAKLESPIADGCLMTIAVDVAPPVDLGAVDGLMRRCIPLGGGSVSGRYEGTVVPGGADWQTVAPDGTLEISARYVLALAEGIVEVRSNGVRTAEPAVLERLARGEIVPADAYYFRTAMRFRTGVSALAKLNRILAVAVGERLPTQVRLTVFPVV
jgi:hypothetical protein